MQEILLKYGRTEVAFEFDPERFDVLGPTSNSRSLSDIEIGERLDAPVGSEPLEDVVRPGDTVLLVVPDATRKAAAGQIVNLLVRRLIANGCSPADIRIIFATGIHREVTPAEKQVILTPFIAQRITTFNHRADDILKIFRVGETSGGIPVELNWAVTEFDHVVPIGGVAFHYFAGFTGGPKLICPGLASAKTISATHKLAFDCVRKDRRNGVGPGLLDGNPVHEAFKEAAAMAKPAFAVNTIVNDAGEASEVFCGDWIESHRAACESFAANHTIQIHEKRELVIASCGGSPYDINLIQAHKALDAASRVCSDGGTIVLMAECADGLGREDFAQWFETDSSRTLAERLCDNYKVNGQTAWSLLEKAERFDVRLVTSLDESVLQRMRLKKTEAGSPRENKAAGYIMPAAGRFAIIN